MSHAEDEARRDLQGTSGCLWLVMGLCLAGMGVVYLLAALRTIEGALGREFAFLIIAMVICIILDLLSLIQLGLWTRQRLQDPARRLTPSGYILLFPIVGLAVVIFFCAVCGGLSITLNVMP
jgi:hypothetical protein